MSYSLSANNLFRAPSLDPHVNQNLLLSHQPDMTLPSDVPRTRRAIQAFFFAPLFCLTISGVVFGFAGSIPPFSPFLAELITVFYSPQTDSYKRGDISQLLYPEGN